MTSRREFLQIGVAATAAWPFAAATAESAADLTKIAARPGAVPLYKVVYDSRFAASVAFARRASARGAAVHPIEGDMTWLWYHDLDRRWRETPAAIAGLTAHGALFCLERLAWDRGMRVVFRSEHSLSGDGVEHRLAGPTSMVAAGEAAVCATDWGAGLADVVLSCPSGRHQLREGRAAQAGQKAAEDGEPLFAWVIAPVARG